MYILDCSFVFIVYDYLNCVLDYNKLRTNVPNPSKKLKSIEPVHEISNNVVCATNKASDQPAHTRSLIRAFASRLNILRVLSY